MNEKFRRKAVLLATATSFLVLITRTCQLAILAKLKFLVTDRQFKSRALFLCVCILT